MLHCFHVQCLAREISGALAENHAVYVDHLKNPGGNPYPCIAEVLDALKDDREKVLAIMDGFDKPLSNGRETCGINCVNSHSSRA